VRYTLPAFIVFFATNILRLCRFRASENPLADGFSSQQINGSTTFCIENNQAF
jgi:hypothetical protein